LEKNRLLLKYNAHATKPRKKNRSTLKHHPVNSANREIYRSPEGSPVGFKSFVKMRKRGKKKCKKRLGKVPICWENSPFREKGAWKIVRLL